MLGTCHRISHVIILVILMVGFGCEARSPSVTSQPSAPPLVEPFPLGDKFNEDLPIEYIFPQFEVPAARSEQARDGAGRIVIRRMRLMPGTDAHHYMRVVLNSAMLRPRKTTHSPDLLDVRGVWQFARIPPFPDRYSCILRQSSRDGRSRIQVAIGMGGFFLVQERDQSCLKFIGLDVFIWLELFHSLEGIPREIVTPATTQP